jgi:hypothetical protein
MRYLRRCVDVFEETIEVQAERLGVIVAMAVAVAVTLMKRVKREMHAYAPEYNATT